MSDPFVAEIRIFGFPFAPTGWAFCDGQLLAISQNTALFSLLGTTYGGDGKTTFALPDLKGNVAMQPGQSPGGSSYDLGQVGGAESVTLLESEMPGHPHTLRADIFDPGDVAVPSQNSSFAVSAGGTFYQTSAGTTLDPNDLTPQGGGQPHNNMQPYLAVNYCIALQGIFPSRG